MNKLFRPFLFAAGCLAAAAACTDDTTGGEPSGKPGHGDKPEYSYTAVEYRKIQSGSFKPWTTADATETRTVRGMNWFSPVDGHVETAWGGRLDYGEPVSVTGTEGYFRVGKADGRWYFLDPDGGAVILHGTQHVRPGTSAEHVASFNGKFGNNAKWSAETGAMLASYGFNYISYGSNRVERFPDDIRGNLLNPGNRKMAYAENLYLLRTFMWDMTANLGYAFEDGTYNRLVLAFEPTFQSYVENLAREKCAPVRRRQTLRGLLPRQRTAFRSLRERRRRERHRTEALPLPARQIQRRARFRRSIHGARRASPRRRPSPRPTARNSARPSPTTTSR